MRHGLTYVASDFELGVMDEPRTEVAKTTESHVWIPPQMPVPGQEKISGNDVYDAVLCVVHLDPCL